MARGDLELDVFKPRVQVPVPSPIVLHIHGGGWKRGDRSAVSVNYAGGIPSYLIHQG